MRKLAYTINLVDFKFVGMNKRRPIPSTFSDENMQFVSQKLAVHAAALNDVPLAALQQEAQHSLRQGEMLLQQTN